MTTYLAVLPLRNCSGILIRLSDLQGLMLEKTLFSREQMEKLVTGWLWKIFVPWCCLLLQIECRNHYVLVGRWHACGGALNFNTENYSVNLLICTETDTLYTSKFVLLSHLKKKSYRSSHVVFGLVVSLVLYESISRTLTWSELAI